MPRLLRSITARGRINGSLSPAAIWLIVRAAGDRIGIQGLAPHDLRRTHARLAREGGAPLETIQHTLGHADSRTTERYCRTGEEANSGDYIRLGPGPVEGPPGPPERGPHNE